METVHTINMAERPNMLQKLADTKTTQTKDMLEKSGAAPARRDQSDFWDLKSKASEAVVMLFYN